MIKYKNGYKFERKPSLGIKMWSIAVLTITTLVFAHTSGSNLVPKMDGRIVGGVDADISEVPYQLSLELFSKHYCGASILKSNVALTAAHCYHAEFRNKYAVRAGSSFRHVNGQVVNVRQFRIHQKYNEEHNDYDVAVALLTDHLKVGSPARLPRRGYQVPDNTVCLASGWGDLYEGQKYGSDRLQKVQVQLISQKSCYNTYRRIGYEITSRMICAYGEQKDACQADSGGPLMANGVQIGIVSWGIGCARPMIPGVYTNIGDPAIHDFITYSLK